MPETVDYKTKKDPKAAAMADIAWWFGDKWPMIQKAAQEMADTPSVTFKQFALALELAGVAGYPARVFWAHLGRKDGPSPDL